MSAQYEPRASEVLFAFAAWLTRREEHVSFGCTVDAPIAFELVQRFCDHNQLVPARDDWARLTLLTHPEEAE